MQEDDEVGRPCTVAPFGSLNHGHEAPPRSGRYSPTLAEGDTGDGRQFLRHTETPVPMPITLSPRPVSPRTESTDLDSHFREARNIELLRPSDDIPLSVRSERFESDRLKAHENGGLHASSERPYADGHGDHRYRDDDRSLAGREHHRGGSRTGSPGSLATVPRVYRLQSGPLELTIQEAERARQLQFAEAQQQWHDAARHAEELRERHFGEREVERDNKFQAIYRTFVDRFQVGLPGEPTVVLEGEHGIGELPASGEEPVTYDDGSLPERSRRVTSLPSAAPEGRPTPSQTQYDDLRELLLECRDSMNAEREAVVGERAKLMELADAERVTAQTDCEGRIAFLETELSRTREELDEERNERRIEELKRIERDHEEAVERDGAMRQQLLDLTDLVSQQHEVHENQKIILEQRWADKDAMRWEKDSRTNALFDMMQQLVRDREAEKEGRGAERGAAAERPGIDQVVEEMRQRLDGQAKLINELSDTGREESAKQVADLMEHIKTSTSQMADFNVTGYLDEFSKALAGEIRQLLTEVGSVHTQRRGYQFELGELLRLLAFYGPGGQFEPDWMPPAHGPLAHQPPPLAPPADLVPLPPDELAEPAWRLHHQEPKENKGEDQLLPPQDTLGIPGAAPGSGGELDPDWAPSAVGTHANQHPPERVTKPAPKSSSVAPLVQPPKLLRWNISRPKWLRKKKTKVNSLPIRLTDDIKSSEPVVDQAKATLNELGTLYARKRNLQFELGEILRMFAFYRPGGQFEPDWMPPAHGPLSVPPPPPIPEPTKPGWKRVQRGEQFLLPFEKPRTTTLPDVPKIAPRTNWQLHPPMVPTPPVVQESLPSHGLFGNHAINSSQYPRLRQEDMDQKP